MSAIEAVISDFGGVLTTPLLDTFRAFEAASGVSLEALGSAMAAVAQARGSNPLFELETGRMSETEFLDSLADALSTHLGREIRLSGFGERYFEHLQPNHDMIAFMRRLRSEGYKLAICTNNVREWEPLWRAMLPVDEIFDVVVDSAFVGARKPDPEIYELTLARLGVAAPGALLIDDIELNCKAAEQLGIRSVWFRATGQAIDDALAALAR
ncbi:MAG TPA: HAD family phosphatase [Solirubrobacteraceae bacterium]